MKRIKKKRLYFVSGLALVMLLVLPVWKLMTYVVADQTSGYVVKANMLLNRTITNESGAAVVGNYQIDQNIRINYTITPQAVNDSNTAAIQQQVVTNLTFTEKLPPYLNIQDAKLPVGFTKTGNLSTGFTLVGSIPDITYTWSQTKQAYIANPDTGQTSKVISFSLTAQVTDARSYNFNKATLNFDDIHVAATTAAPSTPAPASTFNPATSATKSVLGVAGDYNVFVFGDAKITSTLSGSLASGGTTTTSGVAINENNQFKVPYAVVTGGNLNFTNGRIYGNVLHQGSFLKVDSGTIVDGKYEKKSVSELIDFEASKKYLESFATSYKNAQTTGTVNNDTLTANNAVTVFNLPNDFFNSNIWPKLNAKNNSSAVIVLPGKTVNIYRTFGLSGITGSNILYILPDAEAVNISSVDLKGSILAPKATVNFSNGQVHGNIISNSINSSSLIGNLPYKGQMPVLPSPSPTAIPTPTLSPTPVPTASPRVTLEFLAVNINVIRPVTEIRMEGTTLTVGESKLLNPTVMPLNASITTLQWSSAEPTIATVNQNGQVTGIKEGTARITVSATDGSGVSRTVDVIVQKIPITDIQLEGTSLTVNENKLLNATVSPSNASITLLEWSSNNTSFVTVDQNGRVTGIAEGTAQITAKATDGSDISKTVNVTVTAPRTLEISGGTSTQINKGLDLKAVYTGPAGETGINYNWTIVSGPTGASVVPTNGEDTTFIAPSLGDYIVKLSFTSDSITAPIEVLKQISVTRIPLTDFIISGGNQVYAGRNLSLSLGMDPANAGIDPSDITWSISSGNNGMYASLGNNDITKLSNILVAKAFKKDSTTGAALETKVTITVRIGSIEKSLVVDILPMVIRFSKSTHELTVGNISDNIINLETLLYLYPRDIPYNELQWTSSNNTVASFSNINNGNITAHAPGNVKVTVTYKPSQYADPVNATIVVQVKLPDNDDKY